MTRTVTLGSALVSVALLSITAPPLLGRVSAVPPAAAPTFAKDVAPIIYDHCATCHRPGQAAPFSLLAYDDVQKHGAFIVKVTGRRYMPPWHAASAEGFPEFRDDRRLSDQDLATLKSWVDAGSVGPASMVVGDSEILPGLAAGLGLQSGSRGAAGRGQRGAAGGARIGAADGAVGGLGGWVPGMTPRFFPDGVAQALPAHSNLVAQLHLHPSGKAEREQGRLAIYFARAPVTKSLTGVQVPPMFGFASGIDIPVGEAHYTIKDSFVLPVDIETFGARGHAHYLAKEMQMTATLPDGTTKGLLWIDDWDFGWQDSYFYKTPFTLPKSTRIDTTIVYDNSDGNVRNPNTPPRNVKWGRESLDEMGSMTLLVATPTKSDAEVLRQSQADHFRQQLIAQALKR